MGAGGARRVLLMNPNANRATTAAMVAIARRHLPRVTGWTAPAGPDLLTGPDALMAAARRVAAARVPAGIDGIIVSAFGDPGRAALAAHAGVPVVGIGWAAAMEAARIGRFAVATHTPDLAPGIDALMRAAAPDADYLGTFLTTGDPARLTADPAGLDAALLRAIRAAHRAGADAVIVGGGPLGDAADRLLDRAPCRLVAPIPAAARLLLCLMG